MSEGENGDTRAALRALLLERSVTRAAPGEVFKLASGGTATVFFDVKPTVMCAAGAPLAAELLLAAVEPGTRFVGGLETGAIPVVQAVCTRSLALGRPVDAFFVRKAPKGTGTQRLVEGSVPPAGALVALFDDVTTEGGSVLKAVQVTRDLGCTVRQVLTVVDRERGAAERLAAEGVTLTPLFRASELG